MQKSSCLATVNAFSYPYSKCGEHQNKKTSAGHCKGKDNTATTWIVSSMCLNGLLCFPVRLVYAVKRKCKSSDSCNEQGAYVTQVEAATASWTEWWSLTSFANQVNFLTRFPEKNINERNENNCWIWMDADEKKKKWVDRITYSNVNLNSRKCRIIWIINLRINFLQFDNIYT